MKTIAFLLEGFQHAGGIGRSTSTLINELSKNKNYKVITISYMRSNSEYIYKISDQVIDLNLYDKNNEKGSNLNFFQRAFRAKKAIKKVNEIITKYNVDFLIACSVNYYQLALKSVKNTNCKSVCWEHTDPSFKMRNVLMYARKMAIKKSDINVVLTKNAYDYYISNLKSNPKKTYQIYNPIDSDAKKSKKYNLDSKKIISVGRLVDSKNFSLLIDIADNILKNNSGWTWDIYGDGVLKESLQEKITSLNLNEKIKLKGNVKNLYDLYQEYSFLVMTSKHEGLPMTLLEAITNRLPIVSFDIPGVDEVIKNNYNGILTDAFDSKVMIKNIQKMIDDVELRNKLSDNSYEKSKTFSIEKIIDEWKKLWEK